MFACNAPVSTLGSVPISPDFHWPALPVYLAVSKRRCSLGLEQQIPLKWLWGVHACADVKQRLGLKIPGWSGEENKILLQRAVWKERPFLALTVGPVQCCHCALPAAPEISAIWRTEWKLSVKCLEPWMWLGAFLSYVLHITLGRWHYEIPNEESMLLLNSWTRLPPCCPLSFSREMMGYYICD